MTIYLIMLLYWGLLTTVLKQKYKRIIKYNSKLYVFIGGVSLLILMGLRNISVGTDLYSYYYEFINAEIYVKLRPNEPGYAYFNYFISNLGLNFQLYLILISAIVVATISKFYLNYSKNIMLSYYLFVTLGLFAMTMTGLRQTLAIVISIVAYMNLIKKRRIVFFLLVALATLFHNSALSFIVVYFVRNINLTKKKGFILYIMILLTYFAKDRLLSIIQILSPEKYLNKYALLEANVNPLVLLVYVLIPFAVLIVWREEYEDSEYKFQMSNMIALSFINILVYFFATKIPLFDRMSYYFIIYITILLPNVIQTIKSRDIRVIAKAACVILPLVMFLISTPGGSLGIDNYKFFWE